MFQGLPLIQTAEAVSATHLRDARQAAGARRARLARRHRRQTIAAVALAGTSLLAACGNDDDTADAAPPATEHSVHETTAPTAASIDAVEVVLRDYSFGNLPESVPAGTEITVRNESDQELHELVAMRLPDGDERPVDEIMASGMDELMGLGMPVLVIVAPPSGAETFTPVGDGHLTEPGRYLLLCSIPTGADPAEFMAAASENPDSPPDVQGGAPHFMNGMAADLTVTG